MSSANQLQSASSDESLEGTHPRESFQDVKASRKELPDSTKVDVIDWLNAFGPTQQANRDRAVWRRSSEGATNTRGCQMFGPSSGPKDSTTSPLIPRRKRSQSLTIDPTTQFLSTSSVGHSLGPHSISKTHDDVQSVLPEMMSPCLPRLATDNPSTTQSTKPHRQESWKRGIPHKVQSYNEMYELAYKVTYVYIKDT